jgi:phage baseplate assembly protein gpV
MSHSCPRINSNVIVGHLPTGIEQGIVLCATATGNGGALIPSHLDEVVSVFEDGAALGYNPQSGVLNVVGVNQINIGAGGTVSIYSGGSLLLQVGGDVSGTVGGNITLTAGGNANVTAANITLKAGTITLDGPVHITKTLTVDGVSNLNSGGTATPRLTNADGSGNGS